MRSTFAIADADRADVRKGIDLLMSARAELVASGANTVGWKAGFGSPAGRSNLGLNGPLVGFLTDRTQLGDGARVGAAAVSGQVLECEVAVTLGADVRGGDSAEEVRRAIASIGPAFELIEPVPDQRDVAAILAGDIYHRGFVLGATYPVERLGTARPWWARLVVDGVEVDSTDDVQRLPGRLDRTLSALSKLLAPAGTYLRAGDVVICGAALPPLALSGGSEFVYELDGLDPISIALHPGADDPAGSPDIEAVR